MAKSVGAGELRTPITIKSIAGTRDVDGYEQDAWVNVFGEGKAARCKWVNAHGQEATAVQQLGLREPATLTMRYSPLVNETCIIYRGGELVPFEIISIDNVEQRDRWMEIKVQRQVQAK